MMVKMGGRSWLTGGFLVLLQVSFVSPLLGQAPADSLDAWTVLLQQGSLAERAYTVVRLRGEDASRFSAATDAAVIAELERVNDALATGAPLPEEDVVFGVGEEFGQYRIALATMAAGIDTPEARRALVPAIGISRGMQRRVARLGDEAVPELQALISQPEDVNAALETMGFAWFWADSTGAPLSDESRRIIARSFVDNLAQQGNNPAFSGAATGLQFSGDAAFLPLARMAEARERDGGLFFLAQNLALNVIPELAQVAAASSAMELLDGSIRLLNLLCLDSAGDACRLGVAAYTDAREQLSAGDQMGALTSLLDAIGTADREL